MSKIEQVIPLGQQIKTWPNLLSFLRLIITIGLYFLIKQEYLRTAFLLFGIGVITDAADGIIARKYNQITHLGKALDPAADKAFFLTTSYLLLPPGFIWWWGIISFIEMKLLFAGLLVFFIRSQRIFQLGSNKFGKNKMIAEMMLVFYLFMLKLEVSKATLFMEKDFHDLLLYILFGIIVFFAIFSLVGHLVSKEPDKKSA